MNKVPPTMDSTDNLNRLAIPAEKKTRRTSGPALMIGIVLLALLTGGIVFLTAGKPKGTGKPAPAAAITNAPVASPAKPGDAVLTVSGYIIPRARIEISPRFQGTVKFINVKKGDQVKQGDILVQLDDAEFRARLLEAQGNLALSEANLTNAELNLKRQIELARTNVDSERARDDAQRARDVASAQVTAAKGVLALAQTYVDWCTIRSPINGTVLEKLVDPDELVVPQSFGGTRGPSTALVSLADLNDLQVEIDLNEADLSKIRMNQRCRISPEAYMDKKYTGAVAEIAPEANRSKGTLQVKVQIENPDTFLTPELSAKVEFIAD
ncbi:MAG: Multidrug resistance protein MdtA [Verrucomicrobiae bacterium]|nr:Multidrug resistance protein MdtA [Verrucomicrobiae bacterium]